MALQPSNTAPLLLAGKYSGVLDRIPEIRALGATAVMLTPVTLGGAGLGPMGRAPFSFFAPEPNFASDFDPAAAANELKQLIKRLHEEKLEVYFQVEPFDLHVTWSLLQAVERSE